MKKSNKGFTFIELILYMAILGIFMVAVMSLVGTTVASNRKQKSREKLQTQATETYDYISNILMGAMDVAVQGDVVIGTGGAATTVKRCYVVPENMKVCGFEKLDDNGEALLNAGGNKMKIRIVQAIGSTAKNGADCYNIEKAAGSIDTQYLWLSYSPAINKTTFCTIKYDAATKVLSIVRAGEIDTASLNDSALNERKSLVDTGTVSDDSILAENVTAFKTKVNAKDNSIELTISLADDKTGQKYEVSGVVGLRNSYVLKKHEWN